MLVALLACAGPASDSTPKDTSAAVDSTTAGDTDPTSDSGTGDSGGGDTDTAPADSGDPGEDSCATPYYTDADGDHWGGAEAGTGCDLPAGATWSAGDCDDTDAQVHPSTDELCNGVDDDCDGTIDVGAVDAVDLFVDGDADGFGDLATVGCPDGAGLAAQDGDCDDTDATVNPDGTDTCDDGIDQDCTGADARCSFGGTLDYSGADSSWEGDSDLYVGYTLSTVGDYDGDGADDLLIGAMDVTGSGGGGSSYPFGDFVYGGSVSSGRTGSSAMSLVNLDSLSGRLLLDGDFDDDGLTDLVQWGTEGSSSSSVLLHWGESSHYGAWATLGVDNAVVGTLTDFAGSAGDVGDADGDGVDDMVFSRYLGVGVMYGAAGARADSNVIDWPSIEGSGGYFGGGGVVLEDFDGDGLDDIAFADIYMDMSGSDYPGGAYVFSSPGTFTGTLDAYTDNTAVVHGPAGHGNVMAGYELAGGDLDGDGYAELVLGSHMYDGTGQDWIYSGPSLSGELQVTDASSVFTPAAASYASVGVDLVDDLDGDGGRELFVSSTGSAEAWVFAGGTLAGTFDETAAAVTLTGPSGAAFGYHIAHGDLDDDGLIDLFVAGYTYDANAGGVWMFSGTSF